MSTKKNQHLVPVCYLKSFQCDTTNKKTNNIKFDSGIYISNKKLSSGWKMRGLKHGSLTRSFFYNISGDDPSRPIIEEFLSKVERSYPSKLKEIESGTINNENLSFISYFTTIQFIRVEAFINNIQGSFDEISTWLDAYSETKKNKEIFKDIVKKQIPNINWHGHIHPHSTIIYNETNLPFITSDNPVVRINVNIEDLKKVIPNDYILEHKNTSNEFPFFFLPLTPKIAYLSCKLINSNEKIKIKKSDIINAFNLNIFSVKNAYEKLYSSIEEPIKNEQELSRILFPDSFTTVKIYTHDHRIITKCEVVEDTNLSLTLRIESLYSINKLNIGEHIKLVDVIKNGMSIIGMRDCKIIMIEYNSGLLKIKSNLPFHFQ